MYTQNICSGAFTVGKIQGVSLRVPSVMSVELSSMEYYLEFRKGYLSSAAVSMNPGELNSEFRAIARHKKTVCNGIHVWNPRLELRRREE